MDMGAYVVVINAEKVKVTGNKANGKTYFRHVNGRPGSWKIETFNQLQKVRRHRAVLQRVASGPNMLAWRQALLMVQRHVKEAS